MAGFLQTVMEIGGFQADFASDGASAVNMVQLVPYDLILMDIRLPDMTGIAVADAIQKMPEPAASTPIVILTGDPYQTDLVEADKGRFAAVLNKPVLVEGLVDTIKQSMRPQEPPHA